MRFAGTCLVLTGMLSVSHAQVVAIGTAVVSGILQRYAKDAIMNHIVKNLPHVIDEAVR